MADEDEAPIETTMVATELDLMSFSELEVQSIASCSNSCNSLKECERFKVVL